MLIAYTLDKAYPLWLTPYCCLSSQHGNVCCKDATNQLINLHHVHVSKPTLYGWRPTGQTPSRAVPPCMPPVALDELHLLLFALLMPPAVKK